MRPSRRSERGAVTAELAMALPLLVAVTTGLVWLLGVGVAQLQTVDAAREAARVAARGESRSAAVAAARQVAPPGSTVRIEDTGHHVVVVVRGEVSGPGGLFAFLPAASVRARAVALDEESLP